MSATNVSTSAGAPSRNRLRSCAPVSPNSDWYCSFGIASIQSRSASPPGWAYARASLRPYLTSTTCQPAASNWPRHWSIRTPGTTRSSDCRLKSTTHITLPSPVVAGSATASQTLPSSSSASPINATNRECGRAPKCASTYRRVTAANSGAAAPRPTEPVEKSTPSGSFVRDGYDCNPPRARSLVRYDRSRLPSRYWMAWNTGEACGLTATRSSASRWANHSAVIAVTREALDAWCPPTFTPSPVSRSLAASTIRVASHSTRR